MARGEVIGERGASIRRRLMLLIMLVALPGAAERVYSLMVDRQELIDTALLSLHLRAEEVAMAQREAISVARATVQTLSRQATDLIADPAACTALLRGINTTILGVRGAWIGGANGVVVCSTARALVGTDLSDRPYVRRALAEPRPVVSDLVVVRHVGTTLLAVAEAERDERGEPVALAVVGVDLQWMTRLGAEVAARSGLRVQLLDAEGAVLAQYPQQGAVIGAKLDDTLMLEDLLRTDEGQRRMKGKGGENYYAAFVRVPGTGLRVLAAQREAEVLDRADREMYTMFAVIAFGLTALLGLAWYVAERMVVDPVRQLALDIGAVGREEATTIADVDVEEFRPLVVAFRDMSARLAQRTEELRTLAGRLAGLASTDGLTKLANRRTFDVQYSEEWVRAADLAHSVALVMVDVDNFKLYNDGTGHLGGDEALRGVARMLSAAVAGTPYLAARYGGDEFIVLMPKTDLATASDFAEDIRRLVTALNIGHARAPSRRLTASLGVSATVPVDGVSPDALLTAADGALYEAKRLGRNRVVAFPMTREETAPVP